MPIRKRLTELSRWCADPESELSTVSFSQIRWKGWDNQLRDR